VINKNKLDNIAFKVSRSIPLSYDENKFMEMEIPSSLSEAFWDAVKNSSTGREFLELYKKEEGA